MIVLDSILLKGFRTTVTEVVVLYIVCLRTVISHVQVHNPTKVVFAYCIISLVVIHYKQINYGFGNHSSVAIILLGYRASESIIIV